VEPSGHERTDSAPLLPPAPGWTGAAADACDADTPFPPNPHIPRPLRQTGGFEPAILRRRRIILFRIRIILFRIRTVPFRIRIIPFRIRTVPFRIRIIPFRIRTVPFRIRIIPFRIRTIPFRIRIILFRIRTLLFPVNGPLESSHLDLFRSLGGQHAGYSC
jgi:hypothetical protein